jgi:hypothetical protein
MAGNIGFHVRMKPSTSPSAQVSIFSNASREKRPCFQFARLLRSRPCGVRGLLILGSLRVRFTVGKPMGKQTGLFGKSLVCQEHRSKDCGDGGIRTLDTPLERITV